MKRFFPSYQLASEILFRDLIEIILSVFIILITASIILSAASIFLVRAKLVELTMFVQDLKYQITEYHSIKHKAPEYLLNNFYGDYEDEAGLHYVYPDSVEIDGSHLKMDVINPLNKKELRLNYIFMLGEDTRRLKWMCSLVEKEGGGKITPLDRVVFYKVCEGGVSI